MKKVLCILTITNHLNQTVVKDEIYTAELEQEHWLFKGVFGYLLAEFETPVIWNKCLFVELPDLSEEALEKEKQEQDEENNLVPAPVHHNCRCI